MNKNRQTKNKNRWLILSLLLVVVILIIVTGRVNQNKPPTGSTPVNTPSQNEPTNGSTQDDPTPQNAPPPGSILDDLTSNMTYEVIQTYPHDPQAFTQGLIIHEGFFYESTGLYGQSSLRKVEIDTGEVLKQSDLPSEYFGEGLTIWEDALIQLTWRENVGFVYDLQNFLLIFEFNYATEGWGLTHDGSRLIQSDGTATLSFLDPETYQVIETIAVTDQGAEVDQLNELEYIQGEVYANIWQTDKIVRIDPQTGTIRGWIDLAGILPEDSITPSTNVLNGIAYDAETNRLFVTGKNWPSLFEIRLVPKP